MKKAIALAFAVLATSVVAASAQGSQTVAARLLASFNCTKTITLPFVTPLTGGAGFLGAEQIELGEVRGEDARTELGLKVKLLGRRHAGRAGPGARAQTLAQKYIARHRASLACSGRRRRARCSVDEAVLRRRASPHISPSATRTDLTNTAAGDPLIGHAGVLPRRSG